MSPFECLSCNFILPDDADLVPCFLGDCFHFFISGICATYCTLSRQLLIIPPVSLLLMPAMGLNGMWIAFPIAEALSSVVALWLWRGAGRKVGLR